MSPPLAQGPRGTGGATLMVGPAGFQRSNRPLGRGAGRTSRSGPKLAAAPLVTVPVLTVPSEGRAVVPTHDPPLRPQSTAGPAWWCTTSRTGPAVRCRPRTRCCGAGDPGSSGSSTRLGALDAEGLPPAGRSTRPSFLRCWPADDSGSRSRRCSRLGAPGWPLMAFRHIYPLWTTPRWVGPGWRAPGTRAPGARPMRHRPLAAPCPSAPVPPDPHPAVYQKVCWPRQRARPFPSPALNACRLLGGRRGPRVRAAGTLIA